MFWRLTFSPFDWARVSRLRHFWCRAALRCAAVFPRSSWATQAGLTSGRAPICASSGKGCSGDRITGVLPRPLARRAAGNWLGWGSIARLIMASRSPEAKWRVVTRLLCSSGRTTGACPRAFRARANSADCAKAVRPALPQSCGGRETEGEADTWKSSIGPFTNQKPK